MHLPPMSNVRTLPSLITSKVDWAMELARDSRLIRRDFVNTAHGRWWVYSPKMPQHHGSGKDHRCRVGLVGTHEILRDVTAARLKERIFLQNSMRTKPIKDKE